MSTKSRIYKGLAAGSFGQIVTILIQIISMPILISMWGIEKYGEWLVISAIPTYLSFSDFGLTATSSNKISMLVERGKLATALKIYGSCSLLILLIPLLISIFIYLVSKIFDFASLFNINNFSNELISTLIFLLMLHVLFCMQTNLISIPFRAYKKAPFSVFISNFIRLTEWSSALIVVYIFHDPLYFVISLLAARLLWNLIYIYIQIKAKFDFKFGQFCFSKRAFYIIYKPSLATMIFPFGLSLMMQGLTIVISIYMGGSAVAFFNIFRTIARIPIQFVTVINQSIWPELSYAFANRDKEKVVKLIKKSKSTSIYLTLLLSTFIVLSSDYIIDFWLSENVENNVILLSSLLFISLINITWQRYWVFLMSTNKHTAFAYKFLFISILVILLSAALMVFESIYGVIFSIIFGEFLLFYYARKSYLKVFFKI